MNLLNDTYNYWVLFYQTIFQNPILTGLYIVAFIWFAYYYHTHFWGVDLDSWNETKLR